jgi:NADP-reducing hydrogenase subunit HndD
VGTALGEKFHEELGENVSGKLVSFLHKVGVKKVYSVGEIDTAEEKRNEVANMVKSGKVALSGDCPAFVKYVENFYPELSENLVKAPTPEVVFARKAREAYAKENGVNPSDITVVSISSCTAQKLERVREEFSGAIDVAITTVELYEMLHHSCLSRYTTLDVWRKLSPESFDTILQNPAEKPAAIPDMIPGDLKGTVKECEAQVNGVSIKVKAVSGLGNAARLLKSVKDGTAACNYISVRACPGGCVNGGGQPKLSGDTRNFSSPVEKRASAL